MDQNYQSLIDGANNGTFDTVRYFFYENWMTTYRRFLSLQVGAIMLTHELNNYTMSEAIKWYPSLRAAFEVKFSILFLLIDDQEY